MKKPTVIVTRKLPDAIEARMQDLFDVVLNESDKPFSSRDLKRAVKRAQVLVPTVTDVLSADILKHAGPEFKLIANFGAGVDHIDLAVAKVKGITVTNTPSVLTEDVADAAMVLILATPRRMSEGTQLLRSGKWQGWSPTFLLGHRIGGKTLAIVGLGRIGQAVARRAKAFGLNVIYHNRQRVHPSVEQELGVTYFANLDAMLKEADILSLHCPHTPETHHLISATRLKLMKRTSCIVNVARGALIDEKALVAALKNKAIAGVGLDVYEHAPKIDKALLKFSNAVLMPHLSSATLETRMEMGEKVLINIRSFVDHHKPPDRVLT